MNPIANQLMVRKANTATVLETLRNMAPISRADLSTNIGLNRSTISSIIQQLMDLHFVQETRLQEDRIGRPAMPLELNPHAGFAIGLEINVDYVTSIMFDFCGNSHRKLHQATNGRMNQHEVLMIAIQMTSELCEFGRDRGYPLFGIGIGLPGLVDPYQGKLVFAQNIGWRNLEIGKIFFTQFNVPILVENEANCCALAEFRYGTAKELSDFIYLSSNAGVGAGILINGELFRGSEGFAGEIGHMVINEEGNLCSCGRKGCWETYVAPQEVVKGVQQELSKGVESRLNEIAGDNRESLTFQQVVDAAHEGDTIAQKAILDLGSHLGTGILNLVHIFNPAQIVLGGAFGESNNLLIPQIKTLMEELVRVRPARTVSIVPSSLGLDACMMGAATLVIDQVVRDPLNWLH